MADDDEEAKDIWAADDLSVAASSVHEVNVPLIVGTAGNPDMLDAIDGVLLSALQAGPLHTSTASIRRHGITIAAAILAADERMNA